MSWRSLSKISVHLSFFTLSAGWINGGAEHWEDGGAYVADIRKV